MELVILILIAGVGGYLLATSRFSKRIDETGERITEASRNAADRAESWGKNLFRRSKPAGEEVIEGAAVEVPPAEKQSSRRKETE